MVSSNGFLHYGLWDSDLPTNEYSLETIADSQLRYFEAMIRAFPEGAKRVLDVGSGTGSNALALSKRGYAVDCVCPSPQLNLLARSKLPESSRIFESRYEDFNCSAEDYELVMFAESFHYLNPKVALLKAQSHARLGIVIFDYFSKSPMKGRQSYADFEAMVRGSTDLHLASSIDFTNQIAITFDALRAMRSYHVGPFMTRVARSIRNEHPLLGFFASPAIERIAKRWIERASRRESFVRDFEYRLIRLEK